MRRPVGGHPLLSPRRRPVRPRALSRRRVVCPPVSCPLCSASRHPAYRTAKLGTDSTITVGYTPRCLQTRFPNRLYTHFQFDRMVLEFSAHQPSILQRPRQWPDHPSGSPAASSSSFPPNPPSPQLTASQRRRSVAVNFPPAAPPPSQPIPHVPRPSAASPANGEPTLTVGVSNDPQLISRHRSSTSASQNSYGRPAASANLAAVAAFPHNRHHVSTSTPVSNSNSPQPLLSTAPYASAQVSSDPAPKNMTRPNNLNTQASTQDIMPDRLLLSPHHPHSSSESRPSSRRALTRALELAREAVQLDATNDDPHAAVIAYGRSVALLSEVMERVRRGEDTSDGRRRNGRRRSVVAQEEEVRRLKSIVRCTHHTAQTHAH